MSTTGKLRLIGFLKSILKGLYFSLPPFANILAKADFMEPSVRLAIKEGIKNLMVQCALQYLKSFERVNPAPLPLP